MQRTKSRCRLWLGWTNSYQRGPSPRPSAATALTGIRHPAGWHRSACQKCVRCRRTTTRPFSLELNLVRCFLRPHQLAEFARFGRLALADHLGGQLKDTNDLAFAVGI